MKIGFTGSRHAITNPQRVELRRRLVMLRDDHGADELHHGDCVEADLFAAAIASDEGYRTVAHPPINPAFRAHHPSDVVLPPEPYLDRDRAIVAAVAVLIGCPRTRREEQRSGTWYTIRRARQARIGLMVLGPDGTLLESYRPGVAA